MKVYLDNAATTPVAPEVLEAMLPYFTQKFGNPSSIHQFGRESKAAIEKARKKIAAHLNAAPAEIFFTSGGTETANMIISGCVKSLGIKNIITSKIEHHCVLHPVEALEKQGLVKVDYAELDEKGNVKLEQLEKLLSTLEGKTLVCLMHGNNEIGNVLDIERVGELCAANNALFFSDTVQTVAHFPLDMQKIKVHFISGSAHKFHGPKGIGFAFIRSDVKLNPMLSGGSQERNMRAGTENLSGIIGLEKAMELAYENLEKDRRHIESLKQYMHDSLKKNIPEMSVNGNFGNDSLYTVLNISFPKNERTDLLIYNLDIEQIAASAGSACSSGSDAGSHVLQELVIEKGRSSVRFSFSRYNTKEELDYVVEKVKGMFVKEHSN